jgi:hypothetical protein
MNSDFFDNLLPALAAERLDAYRQDQAERSISITMQDWALKLDAFVQLNECVVKWNKS